MKAVFIALTLALTSSAFAGPEDVAYFRQFIYQEKIDNRDPDFPISTHRYLMSKWDAEIKLDDGLILMPQASIFLYENGTYLMLYRESFKKEGDDTFRPGRCKKFEGRWDVPETKLVIAGVGEAGRYFEDNQHKIELTFTENLMTEGLKGSKNVVSYGWSNVGPDQMCF